MISITIRLTLSTHYALFRLRWLMIAVQIPVFILGIVVAAFFSISDTRPVWTIISVISGLSLVVCVWDLSIREQGKTPPSSPTSPRSLIAAAIDRRPQRSAESEHASASTPKAAPKPSIDTDVISMEGDEERVPFLPPPPADSTSEKSEDEDDGKAEHPLVPNKFITFTDLFLAVSFFALYVATLVVESIPRGWGWPYAPEGYAARLHATIGTIVLIILHLHCFVKEFKALRKHKRNTGFPRVATGVLRI